MLSLLRSVLARAFLVGFLVGALGFGGPIALLHARHNAELTILDAGWLWLELGALYGLIVAMAMTGVAAVWLVVRRPWRDVVERARGGEATTWGLFAVLLVYWEGFALYGLTYGETVLVHPQGFWGMAAYLVVLGLLVAIAVALACWLLVAVGIALARRRRVALAVLVVALLELAASLVIGAMIRPFGAPAHLATATLPAREETGVRVLLVGLDGLDPDVVARLEAEGALPTFARLRREGVAGALETLPDSNSAVIWASIYTGVEPKVHGVHDFFRVHLPGLRHGLFPVHRTSFQEVAALLERWGLARREVISRFDTGAPLLWEIADHAGVSSGVVDGYLYSYPASIPRQAESFVIANGIDYFAEQLRRGFVSSHDLPPYAQPIAVLERAGGLPKGDDFVWQARATRALLAAGSRPDLLSFYTHEPDTVSHQRWRSFEPWRFPPWARPGAGTAANAVASQPIRDLHVAFDALLADLVADLGPDDVLFVVSDHGHSPTIVHSMDTQHRHGPPGAFALFGGPVRRGYAPERTSLYDASIYDVAPTVLYLLGLPAAADGPGRVLEELLEPADLVARPVRTVATYRGLVEPELAGGERDAAANRAEIAKLKELGYIR